jgi:putative transposase
MKKARFTDEQIVRILQEADRDPIAAVAKRHGVGESSIYVWRKRFGDMGTDDVKRLRNLEQENVSDNCAPLSASSYSSFFRI